MLGAVSGARLSHALLCERGRGAGRCRAERKFGRAKEKKKVLVIGAGPAGLEAARVAALRGHEVVIYEKESKAGGLVNIGKSYPGRADVGAIVTWLEKQVRALGVQIGVQQRSSRLR